MIQPQSTEITIEEVIDQHAKNVKRTARRFFYSRMLYDNWLLDDLTQQGYLGLIEAYSKFNFKKGKEFFWRYAYKFVKGRMIEFTIQHYNIVRPSQKINSIILKIMSRNLLGMSPDVISQELGCSYNMAVQALHFYVIRRQLYLYDSINSKQENQDERQLIDVIAVEENQDQIFKIESVGSFSTIEQKVADKLIEGYSRENIIEYFTISAAQLRMNIDEILRKCDFDYQKIINRNEALLLQISALNLNGQPQQKSDDNFKWVPIEYIFANPSNPRRDLAVDTNQLQQIIETKGWEEPVTCYKKGEYYILLSGHRRWYAAKQLGHEKMPVFVVDAPTTSAEEKDRLGSLQSVQVEWTPYEIAKNIYDRWIFSGCIAYEEFSKKIGVPKKKIAAKIRVYKYYLRVEIEDKLKNGMYSISMLDYIITWIKRLCEFHPNLVKSLDEDFIRIQMLKKYENKCFNSNILNDRNFVCNASEKEIISFLSDTTKTLKQSEIEMTINRSGKDDNYNGIYKTMDDSIATVQKIECKDRKEAQILIDELIDLMEMLKNKSLELQGGVRLE
ncbi:ParB N-terminal domain-containing protein [Paenibacillus sp. CFBP 13594]|uniref:ParB N-terminal domain-containing protein n=1 Tax=Paenibacillus sp. CFBP 13594 TaxID=2774037 RepID=UPI00177FF3DD|nr:ParB N-terminal domain-containing protein [Paenibacillus sp. CFBP 13594]MBD8839225.1 ParB N-terminal domain-containing protein [Paenibacillus sp. CFBP 13594]